MTPVQIDDMTVPQMWSQIIFDRPLVAGSGIDHKSHLLHINRWDMDQTHGYVHVQYLFAVTTEFPPFGINVNVKLYRLLCKLWFKNVKLNLFFCYSLITVCLTSTFSPHTQTHHLQKLVTNILLYNQTVHGRGAEERSLSPLSVSLLMCDIFFQLKAHGLWETCSLSDQVSTTRHRKTQSAKACICIHVRETHQTRFLRSQGL